MREGDTNMMESYKYSRLPALWISMNTTKIAILWLAQTDQKNDILHSN